MRCKNLSLLFYSALLVSCLGSESSELPSYQTGEANFSVEGDTNITFTAECQVHYISDSSFEATFWDTTGYISGGFIIAAHRQKTLHKDIPLKPFYNATEGPLPYFYSNIYVERKRWSELSGSLKLQRFDNQEVRFKIKDLRIRDTISDKELKIHGTLRGFDIQE